MKTFLLVMMLLAIPATALAQPQEIPLTPAQEACIAELKGDPAFNSYIEDRARYAFHRDESAKATRNNRHVVMAYAAIWVLTVGFLVLVFLRQNKLKVELARLHGELAKATKE